MRQSLVSRGSLRLFLAFFAIYVLWGSTYLAIRVAVSAVPPLFAAGVRFAIAGTALFLWVRLRGGAAPTRLEWWNLSILATLMFLIAYSGLFWAEQTVPSGVASLIVATVPMWTAVLEICVFKRQRMQWTLVAVIALGVAGVAVLALDRRVTGVNAFACLAILASDLAWSLGTVLTTRLALPSSKMLGAGAQMMIGGGMLLICSLAIGEMPPWPHVSMATAAAIAYLIVAGSLIAFTAYQWLLTQLPATKVTSYAYVNPVVALAIGHWLGGEAINAKTIVGSIMILASTVALLRGRTYLTRFPNEQSQASARLPGQVESA